MLTRLYLDNFRCFVNFEHKPARKELILGRNGAGKSSLMDALLFMRQFAVKGDVFDDFFILGQRTNWLNRPDMTSELEAEIDEQNYRYRLVIGPWGDPPRARVLSETVHCAGKPIFEFANGEVHLFNDRFEHKVTYDFDWHRSGLATIMPRKDNQLLTKFKRWIESIYCFRLNPFAMTARADGENLYPNLNLSNLAAWYRHLVQADPQQNAALIASLREVLDDFTFLRLESAGENVRLLAAEFHQANGESIKLFLNQLSDGQRCLVSLYTILHFVVAKGGTVIFDEPDNFISLREIQPWLLSIEDCIDERAAQVLIISHHPEIINQWAPNNGVQLIRAGNDAVRVQRFDAPPDACLLASELIARGWERE